jgi:hypothetical protein
MNILIAVCPRRRVDQSPMEGARRKA